MDKKLIIKFKGDAEDLSTVLDKYLGLSPDTYDKISIDASRYLDAPHPFFITVASNDVTGFTLRVEETSASEDFIDASEILSDLRRDSRRVSIQDLMRKCERYMGYCDLCPYNKACAKILETYRSI